MHKLKGQINRGQGKESIMKAVFIASALASILALALICFFLFANGFPAMAKIGLLDFLLGQNWKPTDLPPTFGILPMILGSIYITLGAIIIGLPIGIFTAVFMARYCPKGLYKIAKPMVELLAGIPSVVYGFFGLVAIVPLVRTIFGGRGPSILAAAILLGIMILPTIIGLSESALRAIPSELYDGALALGATPERAIFRVVLPAAKSGILAAVVLGIGRAIGETMAVIMVAGNQPRIPGSILDGVRSLTANIVMEMGYATDLHREALIATGTILFLFILGINLLFSILRKKKPGEI